MTRGPAPLPATRPAGAVPPPTSVTLLILAGGAGTRMGTAKAGLVVAGLTLIERPYQALAGLAGEVLISGPSAHGLPARALPDPIPGQGPLAGLVEGLRAAATPLVLVVACDMPTVEPALARLLLRRAERAPLADAVVPVLGDRPEPLLAVYRPRARPSLEAALAAGVRAVRRALSGCAVEWVPEVEWRRVDPEGSSFRNCNVPADLAAAAGPVPSG